MPFPDHIVRSRYIISTAHTHPIIPRSAELKEIIAAQLPTSGELFDACRQWGAVRALEVWITTKEFKDGQPIEWRARVEFWQEDEAHRFEVGMGDFGMLIKGWEVSVSAISCF